MGAEERTQAWIPVTTLGDSQLPATSVPGDLKPPLFSSDMYPHTHIPTYSHTHMHIHIHVI